MENTETESDSGNAPTTHLEYDGDVFFDAVDPDQDQPHEDVDEDEEDIEGESDDEQEDDLTSEPKLKYERRS